MSELKKIVILGGESTGKSTLCAQLAAHYKTVWVAEFARAYLESLVRDYVEIDLVEIAKGQIALEEMKVKEANQFIFCDTDLHVLKVWSEYKYGVCDKFIIDKIELQNYDGYILTSPDFPWQQDPLREHPEPALRAYFFKLYIELVKNTSLPYCIVKGNQEERFKLALDFLNTAFES